MQDAMLSGEHQCFKLVPLLSVKASDELITMLKLRRLTKTNGHLCFEPILALMTATAPRICCSLLIT